MPSIPPLPIEGTVQQVLVWIVGVLLIGIGVALWWVAAYVIIPSRDRHFKYLDSQIACFQSMAEYNKTIGEELKSHGAILTNHSKIIQELKDSMEALTKAVAALQPKRNHA